MGQMIIGLNEVCLVSVGREWCGSRQAIGTRGQRDGEREGRGDAGTEGGLRQAQAAQTGFDGRDGAAYLFFTHLFGDHLETGGFEAKKSGSVLFLAERPLLFLGHYHSITNARARP